MQGMHYWSGWRIYNSTNTNFENDTLGSLLDTFSIAIVNDTTIVDGRSNHAIYYLYANDTDVVFYATDYAYNKFNPYKPSFRVTIRYDYIADVLYYSSSNDTFIYHGIIELQSQ